MQGCVDTHFLFTFDDCSNKMSAVGWSEKCNVPSPHFLISYLWSDPDQPEVSIRQTPRAWVLGWLYILWGSAQQSPGSSSMFSTGGKFCLVSNLHSCTLFLLPPIPALFVHHVAVSISLKCSVILKHFYANASHYMPFMFKKPEAHLIMY